MRILIPEQYVEAHGLKMVNDDNLLRTVVEQVIAANPQSVADYRGGKEKSPRLPRRPDHEADEGKSKSGRSEQDAEGVAVNERTI